MLIHNGNVEAVIDWQDAKYGDPVFDLAYMTFWSDREWSALMKKEYNERVGKFGLGLEHLVERLSCYCYFIGLDGMRFFAKRI
ncbi:MAG: phosphotransferase, partial [Spirochaetales bacterium]|nr:phosphotransferase [Spirochaetales bacterium]